ncbi:unnamed protein product [Closterium sp. Naga37s-1]|nr:unnamed protein product [Closterium sp. Naga37s-1]
MWVVWVKNRVTHSALPTSITPMEAWSGQKPHVGMARIWGCMGSVILHGHEKGGKLDARAVMCVCVGVDMESKGWRMLDPSLMRIRIARDVGFLENVMWKDWDKTKGFGELLQDAAAISQLLPLPLSPPSAPADDVEMPPSSLPPAPLSVSVQQQPTPLQQLSGPSVIQRRSATQATSSSSSSGQRSVPLSAGAPPSPATTSPPPVMGLQVLGIQSGTGGEEVEGDAGVVGGMLCLAREVEGVAVAGVSTGDVPRTLAEALRGPEGPAWKAGAEKEVNAMRTMGLPQAFPISQLASRLSLFWHIPPLLARSPSPRAFPLSWHIPPLLIHPPARTCVSRQRDELSETNSNKANREKMRRDRLNDRCDAAAACWLLSILHHSLCPSHPFAFLEECSHNLSHRLLFRGVGLARAVDRSELARADRDFVRACGGQTTSRRHPSAQRASFSPSPPLPSLSQHTLPPPLYRRFEELARALERSELARADRGSILADAVRVLAQLRAETSRLRGSAEHMSEQIRELKAEKSELREERARLVANKQQLEDEVRRMVASGAAQSTAATSAAASVVSAVRLTASAPHPVGFAPCAPGSPGAVSVMLHPVCEPGKLAPMGAPMGLMPLPFMPGGVLHPLSHPHSHLHRPHPRTVQGKNPPASNQLEGSRHSCGDPWTPRADRGSILVDAVRVLAQLRGSVKRICELKAEKSELREERVRLLANKQQLEDEVRRMAASGAAQSTAATSAAVSVVS